MDHILFCTGHELLIPDIIKAENCYLYDTANKKYVDFESGCWSASLGHGHPRIKEVVAGQMACINHTGFNYKSPVIEESAQALLKMLGMPNGKCVYLCSGSEAVEFAIRITQTALVRPLFLTFTDSYLSALGSAGKKTAGEWFQFDWLACGACNNIQDCDPACPRLAEIPYREINAFVFEPGSSSGLVRFPPLKLIENITAKIREHGGLIICNEVTTGIGRTGKWCAYEHYNLQPDIVALGKGLGDGYPVSVAAMSDKLGELLKDKTFKYSQSHQNDPLGAAIAGEVIKIVTEEKLIEQSERKGLYFMTELKQLQHKFNIIKEIRGRGLMIAVEFEAGQDNSLSRVIQQQLLKAGFLVSNRAGYNTLRIDPPLTISEQDIDAFIRSLQTILKTIPAVIC